LEGHLTPFAIPRVLRLRPIFLSIFRADLLSLFEKMLESETSFIGIQHLESILNLYPANVENRVSS
jgi:hypothetical protein